MIIQSIIYRDNDGKVINIGEWDYMVSQDEDGKDVINNPLIDYSTSQIEDVLIGEDGSREAINQ